MRIEGPVVEICVTIDGEHVFALLSGDRAIGCAEADRDLVLSALAEAFALLCGVRPRSGFVADVSVQNSKPAPVLSIVKPKGEG